MKRTRATIANMKALCKKHNQPIAVPGVFAYSFETGEESSASPGDYFMLDDDYCLKDTEENEMFLVRRQSNVVPV